MTTFHRRSRVLRVLGALAGAMLLMTSCSGGSGSDEGGGDDVLTIGMTADLGQIESLNPWGTNLEGGWLARQMTYPHLVQLNGTEVEPAWARSWEASEGGKVYTFELQAGEWSDGQPLTAEDAAWSGNQIVEHRDGAAGLISFALSSVERMEAVDETTLKITYERPVAEGVLGLLANFAVTPKHVYEAYAGGDGQELRTFKPEDDLPLVSGGPFVATSYDPDGTTIFEPNESFYGDQPQISAVGIQIFQNNEAMTQALDTGDLQVAYRADPSVASSLEDAEGIEVEELPSQGVDVLNINASGNNTDHPELAEPDVRRAMSLAIDRDELIEVELDGRGEPGRSIIPPFLDQWIPSDLEADPLDVDAANELLDGLGYARGADGVRVADGRPMSYEIVIWAEIDRIAQILRRNFAEIGIELKPNVAADYNAAIFGPDGDYAPFDTAFTTWTSGVDPTDMLNVYTCAQREGLNFAGWCNERYDELQGEQQSALEEGARTEEIVEMQRLLLTEDRATIPLYHPAIVHVVRDGWDGLDLERHGPSFWTQVSRS